MSERRSRTYMHVPWPTGCFFTFEGTMWYAMSFSVNLFIIIIIIPTGSITIISSIITINITITILIIGIHSVIVLLIINRAIMLGVIAGLVITVPTSS